MAEIDYRELIQYMTKDLTTSIRVHCRQKKQQLAARFGKHKRFEFALKLSLRKALRTADQELGGKKKKFIHLYCGQSFSTKEQAEAHAAKENCKPSRQTLLTQERCEQVLQRKKANHD